VDCGCRGGAHLRAAQPLAPSQASVGIRQWRVPTQSAMIPA
jgi:hypothetical protein